ncbi:hypothetical protein O181_062990 [Austropuccinia psidii MF-1]|uniref:Tf2-1-like SH3-like domain-containing protein n=1 Tax=Austropuccinia psidii MF-1 TaxID=1389203 RepID=A0A9Q3EHZ9_9BASI|nr:hypothetical protein [Austropuccinia psidii MF-1]
MEPDFKEGDKVLVSTLNFNNLNQPAKMRDSFLGPFTIIMLMGKNEVEVKLTEEFSRKHPVFPVRLVKNTSRKRRKSSPLGRRIPLHQKWWRWKTPLALLRK